MIQPTFRQLKYSGQQTYARQSGFSIVELMVAILIGLIILAGVVQVVVTSRTTYVGQEDMSFIQENARYAMDVLGKDIQGAGYRGCTGQGARVAMVAGAAENDVAAAFFAPGALQGFGSVAEGNAGAPPGFEGRRRNVIGDTPSESILIRRFAGAERPVESQSGTTITLAGAGNFASDNLGIVAEDCRRIGVFRGQADGTAITVVPGENSGITSIKPSPDQDMICSGAATCDASYMQNYNRGAVVMDYVARAYYIGTSEMAGMPALMRAEVRGGNLINEEIALGVEDMHLRYGVRANGGNLQYFSAEDVGDWNQVVAVEVQLLFRSQSQSSPQETAETIGERTHSDRHMRQLVTSTFRIRNRI